MMILLATKKRPVIAQITLKGNPIETIGKLPEIGQEPDYETALSSLSD